MLKRVGGEPRFGTMWICMPTYIGNLIRIFKQQHAYKRAPTIALNSLIPKALTRSMPRRGQGTSR